MFKLLNKIFQKFSVLFWKKKKYSFLKEEFKNFFEYNGDGIYLVNIKGEIISCIKIDFKIF